LVILLIFYELKEKKNFYYKNLEVNIKKIQKKLFLFIF
jgi:hypothetical protein